MSDSEPSTKKASLHAPRRSEAIHQELERRILGGELLAGEQLPTEHALAKQFAVSRSVVREAVARLCAEGMVEARQGAGTFVAMRPRVLSFERINTELLQVMELRHIVEVAVAGLAAERRSEDDLVAIRTSLDAIDKALTSGASVAAADDAFHKTIAAAANNQYLQRVVNFVSAQFSESRHMVWAPYDNLSLRERMQDGHQKLFEAIVARDVVQAQHYAAAHLDEVEARIHAEKANK